MKKVFFLFACLSVFAFTAQAQKACSKKCTKKTAACASKAKMAQGAAATIDDAVIAKAASLDESIERKVCAKSGNVSYHMNYVCSDSGKMTSKEVTYDASTAKFVNLSPSKMEGAAKKACCTGAERKACCAGKTKASCTKSKAASSKAAAKESKSKAIKVSTSSSMQ